MHIRLIFSGMHIIQGIISACIFIEWKSNNKTQLLCHFFFQIIKVTLYFKHTHYVREETSTEKHLFCDSYRSRDLVSQEVLKKNRHSEFLTFELKNPHTREI